MNSDNHTWTRIVAILDDETGQWASLCLEYDIASQGHTAEEAAENCLRAVRDVQAIVAEDSKYAMGPPPSEDEVAEFMRYGRVVNGNANLYYLLTAEAVQS